MTSLLPAVPDDDETEPGRLRALVLCWPLTKKPASTRLAHGRDLGTRIALLPTHCAEPGAAADDVDAAGGRQL